MNSSLKLSTPQYSAEPVTELGGDKLLVFARERSLGAVGGSAIETNLNLDGPTLRFTLSCGTSWVGRFADGVGGVTVVCETPNSGTVCVIAKGDGYWVPVQKPSEYLVLPAMPVKEVLRNTDLSLIVFADYTRLYAFDKGGHRWTSLDVSWDGIQGLSLTGTIIIGEGWNAPEDKWVKFSIDLMTGTTKGGACPPPRA